MHRDVRRETQNRASREVGIKIFVFTRQMKILMDRKAIHKVAHYHSYLKLVFIVFIHFRR